MINAFSSDLNLVAFLKVSRGLTSQQDKRVKNVMDSKSLVNVWVQCFWYASRYQDELKYNDVNCLGDMAKLSMEYHDSNHWCGDAM